MIIYKFESDVINALKAFGILFVVAGHLPVNYFNTLYPYIFHMPLFFFLGGVTMRKSSFFKTLKKLSLSLVLYAVVSYVVIGTISVSFERMFNIDLGSPFSNNILDTISMAFKSNFHNNPLFLVCWFLVSYFIAHLLTSLIINIKPFRELNAITTTALLVIAVSLGVLSVNFTSVIYNDNKLQIFNLISQSLYASMFMIIGYTSGMFMIKNTGTGMAFICLLLISYLVMSGETIAPVMSWSKYPSGFLITTISPLLCISIFIFLSKCISRDGLPSWVSFFGKNTKSIMSYHLTIFILVDFIFSRLGLWDMHNSSAFMHFVVDGKAIFYVIAAMIIPPAARHAIIVPLTRAFPYKG